MRAFDSTNNSVVQIGTDPLDADGPYSISYTTNTFKDNGGPPAHTQPNLFIRAYDASGMMLAESALYSPALLEQPIDLMVGEAPRTRIGASSAR